MPERRVAVIGAGIIGLATAFRLSRSARNLSVIVLEKEPQVALHQSSHNSGVLHAGLYYRPGSLKARLAVTGIRQMTDFCRRHGVAHDICGKIVVATSQEEVGRLRNLHERGRRNGLSDLAWLEPQAMREREPYVEGLAALHVPEEGIVDFPAVCRALARLVVEAGGRIVTGAEVTRLTRDHGGWRIVTAAGDFSAELLVNCAGLYSDRIAALAGERVGVRIVPFRGQYYRLRDGRETLIRHLVYPVPSPAFPFLGVHFTRLIGGGVEAGPNASLAFKREGYKRLDFSLRDAAETIAFGGIWRFVARHARVVAEETWQSLSRDRFCRALQRLVPSISSDDLVDGGAGVRAQAMLPDGRLEDDFLFMERPAAVHVLNAPSPAATASLTIADEIARRVERA